MKVVRAMLVAFAALLMAAPTVAQTGYPDRPVRIIVGFTAGSATDITARMFAQKLNAAWNVPVTVENIPGAGGSVGGDRVAKAAPDGTTQVDDQLELARLLHGQETCPFFARF